MAHMTHHAGATVVGRSQVCCRTHCQPQSTPAPHAKRRRRLPLLPARVPSCMGRPDSMGPNSQQGSSSSALQAVGSSRTSSPASAPPREADPQQPRLKAIESAYHPVDESLYDLDLMHYKIPMLRFLSPAVIVPLGLAFVVAANIVAGPSLLVTLEAGAPVLLGWFILLQVLPSVFKDFAVHYLETHEFVADESQPPQQNSDRRP